jgi:23S rRNA (guanosine2251-2'-O)-methyltransferase
MRKERRTRPEQRRHSGPDAIWVWGHHAVLAALANKAREVKRIVAAKNALPLIDALARARQIAPEIADAARLDNLLPKDSVHQGLAALLGPCEAPELSEAIEAAAAPRRVIVLDQITDPHNVGAILRSAAAFGVCAVVTQERHTPQMSGILAKAASGATELVPMIRVVNIARALEELEELGFLRLGLAEEAQTDIGSIDRTRDIALVLGAEGDGMRRLTRENCDVLAALPTDPKMPSLNVSNAAAIALYATRPPQRTAKQTT